MHPETANAEARAPDAVRVVPPGVRLLNVGFDATKRAQGIGLVEVDFTHVEALVARLAAEGQRVGRLPLFVKAVARAARGEPHAHAFIDGRRFLTPGQVDVGVSVAATENFAPVAVVRAADSKPAARVAEELKALAAEKRASEQRDLRLFGLAYRLLLFDGLRRALLAFGFRRSRVVREMLGTIQVSTLPNLDLFWPLSFGTACVVALGRVRLRPWVVDGELRAVPLGYVTVAIDHRILDGWKTGRFMTEVARLLEDPAELETLL